MALTLRPFDCLVLRFEGGKCVVGMVFDHIVVNAGTYGMEGLGAIYSVHSIEEHHHKSPHQHSGHHSSTESARAFVASWLLSITVFMADFHKKLVAAVTSAMEGVRVSWRPRRQELNAHG
jgi:hypothetical protein